MLVDSFLRILDFEFQRSFIRTSNCVSAGYGLVGLSVKHHCFVQFLFCFRTRLIDSIKVFEGDSIRLVDTCRSWMLHRTTNRAGLAVFKLGGKTATDMIHPTHMCLVGSDVSFLRPAASTLNVLSLDLEGFDMLSDFTRSLVTRL